MKKILIYIIFILTLTVIIPPAYSQSRYAECDLCGYCPPHPAPESWAACKKCLYPSLSDDPSTNQSLVMDQTTNTAPTVAPGKRYTFLGCLGNGKSFTDESSSAGVVQSILRIIFATVGGVAFLFLLYGSFIIATSQSQPERLNYGKRLIYGAIVGLLFSLFSVFIVNLITNSVLRIPTPQTTNLLTSNTYGNASGKVDYVPPVGGVTTPTPTISLISPTPIAQITIPDELPTDEPIPTNPPVNTATPKPTNKPKPTSTPKPTKTPTPTPITSNLRPGTSLAQIFDIVGKLTCVPPALLHAFQTQESGPFYNYSNNSATTKIYNTYGWWKTGTGNPCFGLGYHTQTGIVPSDSVMAGTSCQNAIPSGADQAIMGILQISKFEQDTTRRLTVTTLPNNIDRRVLFDNTLIFAYATKNRIGTTPKSCTDWPDDVVKLAAEKHYGNCSANYCTNILKYYKQYR